MIEVRDTVGLRWTIITQTEIVYAGGVGYMFAMLENLTGRKITNGYLVTYNTAGRHIELKSSKTSGVGRDHLFIGDLEPGQSRYFYVTWRTLKHESEVAGIRSFNIGLRESRPDMETYRWRKLAAFV